MSNRAFEEPNAFDAFNSIPKAKNKKIQDIQEGMEIYYKILQEYADEIRLINKLYADFRSEQTNFMEHKLPLIIEKLNSEAMDSNIRDEFIKQFQTNMQKSYQATEKFLSDFVAKNTDEFRHTLHKALEK